MDIKPNIERLRQYIEQEKFAGYDPYDALNSPIIRALSFGSKYPRIAFIQALKRLPINLRPLLFIKKGYNPKGLGLFLWGYAKLYAVEKKAEYLKQIEHILGLLEQTKSQGYSGNCWGYNFDWQSRAFYLPKYTPTIVNSSFIGHALLDTYLHTDSEKALVMAVSIKDFLLKDLNRQDNGDSFCFSYTPIDHYYVHNANLLGASLLARLAKYTAEKGIRDAALSSLRYTMQCQREDGSWYYAEKESAHWVDSFHTGFNLQSILYFLDEGLCPEYRENFERGIEYYRKKFFLDDGTPKYYHDRLYPIDIHAPAQAIAFFSRMGAEYGSLTEKIAQWMISNLQDGSGFFYFQKTSRYTNKIPYMRWGQAWAFHALTDYYLSQSR